MNTSINTQDKNNLIQKGEEILKKEEKFVAEDMYFINLQEDDEFMLLMTYSNKNNKSFDVLIDTEIELNKLIYNYTGLLLNKGKNKDFEIESISYGDLSKVKDPSLFAAYIHCRNNIGEIIVIEIGYDIIFRLVKGYLNECLNV